MDDINDTPHYSRRIADLDSDDKPREKALKHGLKVLTNAELIALVLGSGVPGKSVIELSQEILQFHDNKVGNLARLTVADLVKNHKGVGPAKAVTLLAAIELSQRIKADNAKALAIRNSRDIYNLMSEDVLSLNHEEFWVVLLSRSAKVIKKKKISAGGTAATVVDVKLILKEAIDCLAASLIIVHNHPSGNTRPSPQDDSLTMRIRDAARLFDISLLDHVIIAGHESYFSYADEGRL